MMVFIFVPSKRTPGTTTIDASWSLAEDPAATSLAAARLLQLRAAGIEALVRTEGGALITPIAGSRMVH
jgi:hypothetical protein